MKHRLDALQFFRGLAALGVVLYHAGLSVTAFSFQKIPEFIEIFFGYGYLGVDFFFVLSGFIILSSHLKDDAGWGSAKNYFLKRILRIFPPYLPVSILLLVAYHALPSLSAVNRGEVSLISSLLLLPSSSPPALSVAWTLIHEMLFYFLFLGFYLGKKFFISTIIIWVIFISYFMLADDIKAENPFLRLFVAPINLGFIAGMICALFWKKIGSNSNYGITLLIFGILTFCIMIAIGLTNNRIYFILPFSFIIFGGALLSHELQNKIPRIGVLIGDASYSIYLIHIPLLSLTSRIVRQLGLYSTWWLMLAVGVLASLIAGLIYHKTIEIPVIKILKAKIIRKQ